MANKYKNISPIGTLIQESDNTFWLYIKPSEYDEHDSFHVTPYYDTVFHFRKANWVIASNEKAYPLL